MTQSLSVVKVRRPELDEFNAGLLNCPQSQCKGRASLLIAKGGYVCAICSTFYEYLQLDDRAPFVDHEAEAAAAVNDEAQQSSGEQRRQVRDQAAANEAFARKAEQLGREQVARSLALKQAEASSLRSALTDAATPASSLASLRRDLKGVQSQLEQLDGRQRQIYIDRRVSAARHLLARHFSDSSSGRPLGEHLAARALALFTDFVRNRRVRVHNVRCALSAAIVVVSTQCSEGKPFSEADVWRRLNVPTGEVSTQPHRFARRHCLPRLTCDLTQSIRSYRKEMLELLPQSAAEPSQHDAVTRLVNLYVFDVKPPLCAAFRQRIDAQLEMTLKQLNNRNNEHCAMLNRCSHATLASAIICSALHSFFVPLQGQVTRVSAQWVTRLTGVSRGRIQTVSCALQRLPLV